MTTTLFTPLYLWSAIQALVLCGLILSINRCTENRFLALFFCLTGINIAFQYLLVFTDFRLEYPEYVFVSDAIGLCYGPVLYLYYHHLLYERFSPRELLHFIPAALYVTYFVGYEIVLHGPFAFESYINQPQHVVVLCAIVISNIAYLTACLWSVRKQRNLRGIQEFRLISMLDLLIAVFLMKSAFNVFIFSYNAIFGTAAGTQVGDTLRLIKDILFICSNVIIVTGAQYFLLRHPQVLHRKHLSQDELQEEPQDDEQQGEAPESELNAPEAVAEGDASEQTEGQASAPTRSEARDHASSPAVTTSAPPESRKTAQVIPDEQANACIEKLHQLVEGKKLYLNAELSEKDVSEALGVPSYYLSKILNQHLGKRFNEYINAYRIAEAQRLLTASDAANRTMFAISLDSGFKSESVFYTNFKKFTGCTPRAYKLRNNERRG